MPSSWWRRPRSRRRSAASSPGHGSAAQPDPAESRLEPLTKAQQDRLAQHASLVNFTATTQLREVLSRERSGAELWLIILISVIALAIVEMALAQWFSREK